MADALTPRLNLALANYGPQLDPAALLDAAAEADAAGIDGLTVVDHVVLGGDLESYPYGRFPGGPQAPWLEPLTTLAAIAGRTERIRLMTGILIAPLRRPAVLAKAAATLDVLSEGRLDLGVGTGWLAAEYDAAGLPFAERGRLLDDTLGVCRALWADGPAAFASERLRFEGVWCEPSPRQPGGVPVWIGGELHARNLARIVEHASGWIPSPPAGTDDVRAGIARLRDALSAAGRDPQDFRVRVALPVVRDADRRPLAEESFAAVPELLALGATDVLTPLGLWARDPRDSRRWIGELARCWHASLARC